MLSISYGFWLRIPVLLSAWFGPVVSLTDAHERAIQNLRNLYQRETKFWSTIVDNFNASRLQTPSGVSSVPCWTVQANSQSGL